MSKPPVTLPPPKQAMDAPRLIAQLEKQLAQCMLADRFPLRRRLQQLRGMNEQSKLEKTLVDIAQKLQASIARYQSRLALLPKPEYPPELPVSGR
ncbi:MAG: hypothetical protein V4588_00810, partial [Pseudomonadota bacterium]